MGGGGLFAKHQIFFEIVHKRFNADSIGFTVLFVLFTYHRSSFHPSLFIAAPFTAEYQRELDTGILTEDTLTKKLTMIEIRLETDGLIITSNDI